MDVIKLLKTKNRCLERVLNLSIEFLSKNDLAGLEAFQIERAAIFKAIDLYDRKIVEQIALLPAAEKNPAMIAQVSETLREKERLIREVLTQDNELMLRIEEKKQKIVEELSSSRKSHELVGKFKSSWLAAGGEELDKTI